jgi:hypothetical protein
MAVDPLAREQTITYPKGSVTAPLGLLNYIFGDVVPVWEKGDDGPGRRPYGTRQRANAAAGEPISLKLVDGGTYTVRVTGTHKNFIDQILSKSQGTVLECYSERGTIYGPQAPAFLA